MAGAGVQGGALMVLITAGSREEAVRLAEMLVGARLAACVQILPEIESVYRWQGEVERAAETLLFAKTNAACFSDLEREVRALHSYETPEIIALPLAEASAPYLAWLNENIALVHGASQQGSASSDDTR
jgi:periplasmic divalent cation tolerance protein